MAEGIESWLRNYESTPSTFAVVYGDISGGKIL